MKITSVLLLLCASLALCFCTSKTISQASSTVQSNSQVPTEQRIIPADERLSEYLPLLKDKNVALLVNQTSVIGKTNLVDTLISLKVHVKKIFAPEHGFRGNEDAGEKVKNSLDPETGLPVISLYGDHKKPTADDLNDIDVIVYDIQDVGARFYTFISTMHYAMEACAENGKTFIVLDRPNPNGFYVDGPVLDPKFKSFVGMDPVPVVYGMTEAEYAEMVNEEGWLKDNTKCDLKYVLCGHYDHKMIFTPPIKPSPNLPNLTSILLYPSLCFFEGTVITVGRGTDTQYQVIGNPAFNGTYAYSFTPTSKPGATGPVYEGQYCYGYDLSSTPTDFFTQQNKIQLKWLIEFYNTWRKIEGPNEKFFSDFFTKLAGNDELQQQIENGLSEDEIRASWQEPLTEFKKMRKKYLLYPDFE